MILKNSDIELAEKAIALSNHKRNNYTYKGGHISEVNTQTKEYEEAKAELESFMNDLSFEEIKYLQTLMYLGRDTSEEDVQKYPGGQLFQSLYDSLSWGDKDIETRQMTGKTPLDKYLKKGLEILKG